MKPMPLPPSPDCPPRYSRRVVLAAGAGALLGSRQVSGRSAEAEARNLLTRPPWARQLQIQYLPLVAKQADPPWSEGPRVWPATHASRPHHTSVTVEWTSAAPVRHARQVLGRPLPDLPSPPQYIVGIVALPYQLVDASAYLTCPGHPLLECSRPTPQPDGKILTCWYFFTAKTSFQKTEDVLFRLVTPDNQVPVSTSFHLADMLDATGALALL
jgi:hypothetical protein